MTTNPKASDTATAPQTAEQNSTGIPYDPKSNADTQQAARDQVPLPYAKVVATSSEARSEQVSVVYDNERAQREMAFLRLNEVLESRRR